MYELTEAPISHDRVTPPYNRSSKKPLFRLSFYRLSRIGPIRQRHVCKYEKEYRNRFESRGSVVGRGGEVLNPNSKLQKEGTGTRLGPAPNGYNTLFRMASSAGGHPS
jgi:hypothetical protein